MSGAGEHKFSLRMLIDETENQRTEGVVEIENESEDWMAIPFQPVRISVPGSLSLEQRNENGGWDEFFRIPISRPPTS